MNTLLRLIQKQKLFIHYLTVIIVIAGIFVLTQMQREARPNVNFNRVIVTAVYPGASPSDIEELVIDPIEEKVDEVDGIEEYRSVSYVGAGSISIKIDDTYPNPEAIVDEIRKKVLEVDDLPLGVDDPIVTEAKASNIPVLNLALYGQVPPFTLKLETEKLKDFLQRQEGVQRVNTSGISELQLKVIADAEKLDQFDLTLNEISSKISSWAKQRPGGLFEGAHQVTNLTIGEDLDHLKDLQDFVLRSNDSGQSVKVSDVSEVQFDLKSLQKANLFEGQDAILFTVIKKPFADSIKVVDNLNKILTKYQESLNKDLSIEIYKDQSIRIRNKLKIVTSNAIGGLILVLLILLIFLDGRSSIVTSIGIPISILGGICLLYFMGHTMNSLVVVGIIIVLGMLVDDAIVVCENIYSYLEKGLSPAKAAIQGTSEIALPVIASVLTTVFAFLPIVFMKDIIGQFLRVIPITVVALLAISLLEAMMILPIHAKELMRPPKKKTLKRNLFKKVEALYEKYLKWSLKKRWYLLILLLLFFVISGMQGKKIFEKFGLFPARGLKGLSVRVELEKNTLLYKTSQVSKDLTQKLQAVSKGTFDHIYSNLGSVTTGGHSGTRQEGSHLAMIHITFVSDSDFIYKEKAVVSDIRKVVTNFAKSRNIKTSMTLDRPGPPIGKPIQLQVTARDLTFAESIVSQIKGKLAAIKGVHSLETDLDGDRVKYRFRIDNELAVSEGVDPNQISRTIFASSTGRVVNEILKNNEKVEILVTLSDKNKDFVHNILDLKVRNKNGQAVPIRVFAKVLEEQSPSSIQRLNGLRTITLFGEVDENIITGKEANKILRPFIKELQSQYPLLTIVAGGGERDRLNALSDTMKLYIFAIILIFMVISLTFQSVVYPFLVLTAIPMGLSGVVWSLVLHNKSLSLMGIIGIVGLSGVVVNVSIILLKFMQDKLSQGIPFREAIVQAGMDRLRPMVMTTVSTLLGLLPTIYGFGGIDILVQPIALVLGWGLFIATG